MLEQRYRWKNKHLREHVAVIDGKLAPTILLKNARYLNQTFRKWMTANIWIYDDRIVYVGEKLPHRLDGCEVVDCTDVFTCSRLYGTTCPSISYYIIPFLLRHMHPSLEQQH